jgi:two-component system, cell cycle sensor histidine kinase and response regulator CckA
MNGRVLLADDDPDFLDVVALWLEREGAAVVRATSGAELLEQLAESGPFDLVITDVSMPWMSGLHVATAARTAGLHVPFIVMTGLADRSLAARVVALGNQSSFLRKPFSREQLEAAILSSQSLSEGAHTERPV